MKILLIRHGDPDYTIDSLTEKGQKEAQLLAERIAPMDIKAYSMALWITIPKTSPNLLLVGAKGQSAMATGK